MESVYYTQYKKDIVPALKEQFGYKNVMQVPKIEKVTINVGYGKHAKDKAYIDNVDNTLNVITGQRPMHNKARKSISNFKIREGMEIGASVTLRGARMYYFLYRLVNLALPRVRYFRGLNPKSFDAQGNYSFGLKENIAFPEISTDAIERIHPLEIVVTTTAESKDEGYALLEKFGFPFEDKK